DGGGQPAHHLVGGHHGLAVEMTATLRVDLVLEMAASDARVLEDGDRPCRAHRLAEAGVGVDEHRQVGDPCDLVAAPGDFGQGGQPDIGQAEIGRELRAGVVDALASALLNELGNQRVERPRDTLDASRGQARAEGAALVAGRGGRGEQAGHQNSPFGDWGARASTSAETVNVSSDNSLADSSPARWTTSRKRSCSAGSMTPSARVRNLAMYCSRANGRAPSGWASATASSSTMTSPFFRVTSARAPKAFSFGSVEW